MVRCNVFILSLVATQALVIGAYWYLAGHEGYGEQMQDAFTDTHRHRQTRTRIQQAQSNNASSTKVNSLRLAFAHVFVRVRCLCAACLCGWVVWRVVG